MPDGMAMAGRATPAGHSKAAYTISTPAHSRNTGFTRDITTGMWRAT
ncbi:hypothetical protein [Streptomyces regalis]|nr:hypothetical protein [Streptomyces regalis]